MPYEASSAPEPAVVTSERKVGLVWAGTWVGMGMGLEQRGKVEKGDSLGDFTVSF